MSKRIAGQKEAMLEVVIVVVDSSRCGKAETIEKELKRERHRSFHTA